MKEASKDKVVVALFGLSGSGKSFTAQKLINKYPEFIHLVASDLIKEGINLPDINSEKLRKMSGKLIDKNQEILVSMYKLKLIEYPNKNIIFDGHNVIDNGENLITISDEVIYEINPDIIVYVEEQAKTINQRRSQDSSRIRPVRSNDEIQNQQKISMSLCEKYSKVLNVPLCVISSGELINIHQIIRHSDINPLLK